MRAVVLKDHGQWSLEDRPVPKVGASGDLLIEVEGCGICGTDVKILSDPPQHPARPGTILGHEFIGRIVSASRDVNQVTIGDRVAVIPNLYCRKCAFCLRGLFSHCTKLRTLGIFYDGGFAQYARVPSSAVIKVSETIPLGVIVFAEVLSTLLGVVDKAHLPEIDTVLILGCGPTGLLLTDICAKRGVACIMGSEPSAARRVLATALGAIEVTDPQHVSPKALVDRHSQVGADLVIDTTGKLLETAVQAVRARGKVILFGLDKNVVATLRPYDLTCREVSITGSCIGIEFFPAAIEMLESGAVSTDKILTAMVPLNAFDQALSLHQNAEAGKVVILPGK